MPIHWPGKPGILDRFNDDIILLLAEGLAESHAYGTISALCMTSQELKRVLGPWLAERKKKVWMRLDDWSWEALEGDGKERYHRIGIIECTSHSPLPINLQHPTYVKKPSTRFATEQRLIHTHCRPWMLIFKGNPHRSVLTLYERFFPAIKLLKFIVDSGAFQLCDIDNGPLIRGPPESTVAVNRFATYLMEKRRADESSWDPERRVPQLRYARGDGHGGIDPPAPGRIMSSVVAIARTGFEFTRQEWSYYGDDEDLSEAEAYCLYQLALPEEPPRAFKSINIDVHIDTAHIPDQLFYGTNAVFPPGYNIFSDLSENLAHRHLSPVVESTLEFRLFYRHGSPLVSETEPIFWSKYALSPGEYRKLRTLKRDIDEDFANCKVRASCKRCRGQVAGVVEI